MAGELIWSRAALDDIEAVAAFIARDSRVHARRFVERIFAGGEQLLAQPTLGGIAPESSRERVYEHRIQGFRLLCERQGEDLHLLAVVHGRGQPPAENPPPRPVPLAARPVVNENPWLSSPVRETPLAVIHDPLDDFQDLE